MSILFTLKNDTWKSTLKEGIERSMNNYKNETKPIDVLQTSIKCCGSENYTDWFNTPWAEGQKKVPTSCCVKTNECKQEDLNPLNVTFINQQGCFAKVDKIVQDKYMLIVGIGFASSLIILGGSFLTCLLAQNLNKHRYEQMA